MPANGKEQIETQGSEMIRLILLMIVVAAAIFARCDSMEIIEVDSASESDSLIELVRTY